MTYRSCCSTRSLVAAGLVAVCMSLFPVASLAADNMPPARSGGLVPAPVPPGRVLPGPMSPIAPGDYVRGMAYTSWAPGVFSSPESDAIVTQTIPPYGVKWLAVATTWYSASIAATSIARDPTRSPTDADLHHVIALAQSRGFKVLLKPDILLVDGDTPTAIGLGFTDSQFATWFASYRSFINHYASIAQTEHVAMFSVGTELKATSQRAAQWRKVIAGVRARFSGPLTYAANFDEDNNYWQNTAIQWWDALDYIGSDAYFPLTNHADPTLAELKAALAPIATKLAALSARWQKQIIFTEAGYQPLSGANMTPWGVTGTSTYDPTEQANCYQALLDTFVPLSWWAGVFFWEQSTTPGQSALPTYFTPLTRPAGAVMAARYIQSGRS